MLVKTDKQARPLVEKMLYFFGLEIDGIDGWGFGCVFKTRNSKYVVLDEYFFPLHFSSWKQMFDFFTRRKSIVLEEANSTGISNDIFSHSINVVNNPFYGCSSLEELKIKLDLYALQGMRQREERNEEKNRCS